ncbi:MAG: hypothetical protein Q9196_005500 [Gyalolechia fulgens]
MRGSSPLATRTPASFSAPYNPQQWGPSASSTSSPLDPASRTRQAAHPSPFPRFAPRPLGPDEPVASPPPPYSPRRQGRPTESLPTPQSTVSPSDTLSPATDLSQQGTPVSAATTMSPEMPSSYGSGQSSPPSATHHLVAYSARGPAAPAFPPPPPATQAPGQRTRSSSKSHAERLFSTLGSRSRPQPTSPPPSAIDTLRLTTAQTLAQTPELYAQSSSRPPASRRAASTGGIGLPGQSSRTTSRSPSQTRWAPGMPLPPPPPGPPPAGARSQSLNRSSESSPVDRLTVSAPRSRRPPGSGTALAPVPPTPADWREEQPDSPRVPQPPTSSRPFAAGPLYIDTGVVAPNDNEGAFGAISAHPYSAHVRPESSSGALARSPAVRNRSAKGIRERRSESRNGKERATDTPTDIHPSNATVPSGSLENLKPTDLILPTGGGSFLRRRATNRISPSVGKRILSLEGTLRSSPAQEQFSKSQSLKRSNTGSQSIHDRSGNAPRDDTPRPPFSPARVAFAPGGQSKASPSVPPKILSTPQSEVQTEPQTMSSLTVPLAPDERPISHILHIPNPDGSIQEPLLPCNQTDLLGHESPRAFANRAIERHRVSAEREATASNDSERLEIFVHFVVAESRIRREKYAAVFEEEEISIPELMQGLFEHPARRQSSGEIRRDPCPADQAAAVHESRTSSMSDSANGSDWRRSSSVASRAHDSPVSATTDCSSQNRPESSWWNDYVPCLSPIASMSIATGQDHEEMGSRGRASSRWWEDKSGGSAAGDAFSVLKKSKRESKYMGLPKESRDASALFEITTSRPSSHLPTYNGGASQPAGLGPNEYPPEKAGWHQESSPLPPPPPHPPTPLSAPFTPDPRKLDISRFVTLPPPYPRHHPAVSNSHPDLADVRAVVRSLHETESVDAIRASYQTQIGEKRKRAESWCQHQRSLHDQDMRFRMDHEDLSQDQFDRAESEIAAKVRRSEKELTQTDFDLFQTVVVSPLHALFSERIAKADLTIEALSGRLFSDAQTDSPNLPQEEGDEQPELLEKLTQLKWLFEARETLHRKTYDLLSERNDKYRAVVLLPYQQSSNHEKCVEAEQFFANDVDERRATFEHEISSRFEAFWTVIEANVTRGVEVQLSAFWDIAPPLHRVLTRVPHDLHGFEVQIPADEYGENPDYYAHPLQYLYSLLTHAQKSTYQFIESQINLLCLLHEVKNAAMNARYQAQERKARRHETFADLGDGRRREEARLTEDLKEKVGVVEGLWKEALGEDLMAVRERVRCWLLENGGWDDEHDAA